MLQSAMFVLNQKLEFEAERLMQEGERGAWVAIEQGGRDGGMSHGWDPGVTKSKLRRTEIFLQNRK
jgi:hypothetical protein